MTTTNGKTTLPQRVPTLILTDTNTMYGFSGCNRFFGRYSTEGNTIKLEPGGSTMMACPDMEIEDAILKAMGNVKGVKAGQSENEMLLVDADGNVLMVLSKN